MFYHTNDAAESKMAREMLCFKIKTAMGGRKVGGVGRAVAAMSALGVCVRNVMVVHMVCCARLANHFVMVVSRWLGV